MLVLEGPFGRMISLFKAYSSKVATDDPLQTELQALQCTLTICWLKEMRSTFYKLFNLREPFHGELMVIWRKILTQLQKFQEWTALFCGRSANELANALEKSAPPTLTIYDTDLPPYLSLVYHYQDM